MSSPLVPHDNYTYLTMLAHLLGQDSEVVLSAVESQYSASKYTQPGWFEAVKEEKAALLTGTLAIAKEKTSGVQAFVLSLDPEHPEQTPLGRQPVAQVIGAIADGITALVAHYADETAGLRSQLPLGQALLAALERCYVAIRQTEPTGTRTAQQAMEEPYPVSALLKQVRVHLMLMIGQYEMPVAAA